jgi:hypothetical protein
MTDEFRYEAFLQTDKGDTKMAQSNDFQTDRRGASVEERPRTDRGAAFNDQGEVASDPDEAGTIGRVVARYPYPSVLTGFGFGFGFGLVVTLLLNRREPTWFERYMPEPIQHLPDRLKGVPESLGSYWPGSWKHS